MRTYSRLAENTHPCGDTHIRRVERDYRAAGETINPMAPEPIELTAPMRSEVLRLRKKRWKTTAIVHRLEEKGWLDGNDVLDHRRRWNTVRRLLEREGVLHPPGEVNPYTASHRFKLTPAMSVEKITALVCVNGCAVGPVGSIGFGSRGRAAVNRSRRVRGFWGRSGQRRQASRL